jgi:hypothetical protein
MADRFPLIVNAISKKIEEIVSGDNLELTGNGLVISGDTGAGKYLTSDGNSVFWGDPGNVYLTQSQTLTNKTLETCVISGTDNTLTNIPNSSLLNSGITINGSTVNLGSSIVTPDTNTTYSISLADGAIASEKIIRLSAGGSGTGSDDVTLIAGSNMTINRSGDELTFISSYVDTDTVTTIAAATGGTAQSGNITIAATGASTVSQDSSTKTITVNSTDTDTITRLRATTGSAYNSGDVTFLASGSATVSQGASAGSGDPTITYNSVDTITRVKGGTTGSFQSGDITIVGGTNSTIDQTGTTLTVNSTDTNTVTRVATGSNSVQSGDFVFTSTGATSIAQSTVGGVTTINISSVNTDTGASITASGGLLFTSSDISLKNNPNLVSNTVMKWDGGNTQLANSIITDDGSTVTIGGDLLVTGTQTVLEVSTLIVEDNIVELRKGNSLPGADGGIQINRTTDSSGNVTSYQRIEWSESAGTWRFNDGSVQKEIINSSDTQTLVNKTLTSPIMTGPTLGAATATSINGLEITPCASSVLTFTDAKTLEVKRDLVFTSDNNLAAITTNFRSGGNVAYTSDTLAVFNSTTSTQLRALINGTTGTDKLVFSNNPQIEAGFITASPSLTIFNTAATDITMFGAATTVTIGASTGITNVNHDLHAKKDVEIGVDATGSGGGVTDGDLLVHGIANFDKNDIQIRGTTGDPLSIGRGGGSVNTNTRVGAGSLDNNSSGFANTAFGYRALLAVNSGASNTGVGHRALNQTGNGQKNVAVGSDSMRLNTSGQKNVAYGTKSLENNLAGVGNVCIGHYAGWGVTGTGNVLIGAADDENSTNATHTPDDPSGDRQLVIGSGSGSWIKGDSNFAITVPNNFTVEGNTVLQGQLTVNGTLTSINSNIIQIDDKNLELAAVVNTTFEAVTLDSSNIITAINPTANLIPGMEVVSTTGGISVPVGTLVVSINSNQATLSSSVSGTGTATFIASGPSDTSANGGGVIVKGTTNHSILYDNRTSKFFNCTDNFELAFGKSYYINNQLAVSTTTLGSTIVNSSLTSVGVLIGATGEPALEVDGAAILGGRVLEKLFGNFSSNFTLAGNTLTISAAAANTIVGNTSSNTAINEWAFTTADPDGNTLLNSQSLTLTLIIDASTASSYGDACSVDGSSVSNGVEWSGGSPPIATSNTDILTFVIVKDSSGVTRVFGQGNTDFS